MRAKNLVWLILAASLLSSSCLIGIRPAQAAFDLSQVSYYDRVKNALSLTTAQEVALLKNGFVSVNISAVESDFLEPNLRFEDFYYRKVYANDLPVFVTTDSILHLFHVVFDCSLKTLERQIFFPMLLEVTQFAFNTCLTQYNSIMHDNSAKYWAIRNSTVYFAVGLSLLTNSTVLVPDELMEDVNFFLNHAWADQPEFVASGCWLIPEPPYMIDTQYDFTQFKVRGHYLGEARLEQYFRAFMWYGQMPVFIPRNDENYLWFVPHFNETLMIHVRDVLKSNPTCYEKWMQLYNVTSALIGESDSISPLSLETALQKLFGNADSYLDYVVSGDGLTRLREELSKPEYEQRILSQALCSEMPGVQLPHYPLIFQFMGQRYVPDSYIFQMLCWDKVGFDSELERRIMPKGLDVFAALGSERASQLLIPDHVFENFESNLANLKQNVSDLTEEDWTQSSYMAWMHALQSLVEPNQDGMYPEFMKSLAWQDEKLNTGLGSWAQLRHDTLLYAKQTYIPIFVCSYPEAFVEPYPSFYARMQKLSQRTIDAINTLDPSSVEPAIMSCLEKMKNVTVTLETVSAKELANEPLTEQETEFIKQIAWKCGSGGFVGWYVDTIHAMAMAANSSSSLESPVIADVATFPPDDMDYPPQILHVGTGYVNALVVLFPLPNGTLVAAVGPVFSYYEFRLIGTKRLNDDEWKEILTFENITSYLPEWLKDVYGSGEPWPALEYPNAAISAVGFPILTLAVLACARAVKTKKWKSRIRKMRI
jgi:hypothetical protein